MQSNCSLLRLIQHLQPSLQVFKSEATFKHSLAWTWFNTTFAPTEQTLSMKDLDHSKSLSAGSLSPCMYTFWTRWLKVSLTWSLQACACRGQPPGCHWTLQDSPSVPPTTNTFPALIVLDDCEQGHEAQEVLLSETSDWLYTTHC